jgi:hypothetical protein
VPRSAPPYEQPPRSRRRSYAGYLRATRTRRYATARYGRLVHCRWGRPPAVEPLAMTRCGIGAGVVIGGEGPLASAAVRGCTISGSRRGRRHRPSSRAAARGSWVQRRQVMDALRQWASRFDDCGFWTRAPGLGLTHHAPVPGSDRRFPATTAPRSSRGAPRGGQAWEGPALPGCRRRPSAGHPEKPSRSPPAR